MSQYRRIICLILLLVLGLCASCSKKDEPTATLSDVLSPASQEETQAPATTLLMLHSKSVENPLNAAAEVFCSELEKESGGQISVQLFPNGTLGARFGMPEAVRNGTVDLRIGRTGVMESILYDLPMLTDNVNIDYLWEQLQPGARLYALFESKANELGFQLLGVYEPEYRVVSSNTPIQSIDDFSRLHFRITGKGFEQKYWESLGAKTEEIDYSLLYMALQEGIVNAQENTFSAICADKLYERQSNITFINFEIEVNALYMNLNAYNQMDDASKAALNAAAQESVRFHSQTLASEKLKMTEVLKSRGLAFMNLPPSVRDECQERLRPLVTEMLYDSFGKDYVDRVVALAVS